MFDMSSSSSDWVAEIYLRYQLKRGITRLIERKQVGPLMVQRPFYPEHGSSHTYLLHPPGGVVAGDLLSINVVVEEGAHSLITTPGATKFYRSIGEVARQAQNLRVEEDAFLEWLPLENIFFPSAAAILETNISLKVSSRFIGWDMQCFGRPMLNETFESGNVIGQTKIFVDDKLILADSLCVDSTKFKAAGMREFPMLGAMYIYPASEALKELVHCSIQDYLMQTKESLEIGLTDVDGLLTVRALGHQTEEIMGCLVLIWKTCRKLWLGYVPDIPRIWAT
ncbi:urease accessory protein UreD [Vibrio parahaemolyticus]|nr:urease accessory protein UreD [Vibrio parahaemolyticus]EGR0909147.1 urease accessory protein UreD [Vibrio parahaemolyticus]EGV3806140.1 urease accessory protein UreD [Vibrio parahaemolyticus]EIR4242684.1 urease accessory protein UreD [Vibrio parahaemolyticus]